MNKIKINSFYALDNVEVFKFKKTSEGKKKE